MRSEGGEDDWDFSPVIDLIHSFSFNGLYASEKPPQELGQSRDASADGDIISGAPGNIRDLGLGNFGELWEYLGRPLHVTCLDGLRDKPQPDKPQNNGKGVRWRDEINGADFAKDDEIDDNNWLANLTKRQRKKARRKQRRMALESALTGEGILPSSGDSHSEDEKKPRTPDRKAIIHELLERPLPDENTGKGVSLLKRPTPAIGGKEPTATPPVPNGLFKSREESVYAAAASKKAKLMTMLKERFLNDRQYLDDPNVSHCFSSTTPSISEGIHIFIDASNIMIGFHDALKLSRSLPLATRMRRQTISFHSLSLLLSRGRPAVKRIVVGSDNSSEMAEAKLIGYETNILDRVQKAKELTPRRKKYARINGDGTTSAGSGSEMTTAVQHAPEKWVEQAVDEILHLKMMESIVDAAEPSTMVLATGDAAEAEYSGGFLKMVERALQKGWRVELASFKHNISSGWRRREWRQRWGERFKILELDAFVEVLLRAT
ncbi:MAG: hypothetical protein Q9163_000699 [Psora crenata]